MTTKLVRHGNGVPVTIEKPILELLNVMMDAPLAITTDLRHRLHHNAQCRV